MTRAIAITYTYVETHIGPINKWLLAITLVLCVYYSYSLYESIYNTITIQKTENNIALMNAEVSKLNSQYVEMMNNLSKDGILGLQLSKAEKVIYINSVNTEKGVAFKGNEF